MLMARRIYLYLVAAISLVGITWAVIGLARLVLSEGIGKGQITGLATWLAIIIVGLPIFLFHWLMAQRLVTKDEQERNSVVRRIYFYGVMGAGAAPIASNIYRLVDNGFLTLVGGKTPNYYPYDLTTAEHLAALFVWTIIWLYIWRQVQIDNRLIPAGAPLADLSGIDDQNGIRRLYLLILSLAGLVMVSWGAFGLLRTLLQISASVTWRTPVANHSAQLLVGGVVWASHWLLTQRSFFSGAPTEERSVLRKIYLYLAVFVFSVLAVGNATVLLKRLIELALGDAPSQVPLLIELSWPLPLAIVGAIFWAYHWFILRQDASQAPEAPRQASVRRIYAYLVAAIGLAALLVGVGGLLSLVIDLLTSPAEIGLAYYREQVALFTAMTIVGTPVWLVPWRTAQRLAITPAEGESREIASVEERRSTVRKIYLYFYVFVAALAVFGSVGWFVFHILTAILGADLPEDFMTQVLDALIISLLAAGVWLYHWWAIRQDGRLEREDQARRLGEISVVIIDGEDGKLGQTLIQQLQHDLPGLRPKSVGLTSQAAEAMSGQLLSAGQEAIEAAHYVIGSWQSLTARDVAPLVTASSALKLVAPIADRNWVWAGIKQRSLDYYARQATRGIKQAIDGDEISPAWEIDAGLIVSVGIGIVLFLCAAGSLIGVVASL